MDEPEHKDMQEYVKKLLHMYKKYPALYTETKGYGAFEWINADDAERSIFSFIRKTTEPDYKNSIGFVCSFTPIEREDYCVGVPKAGVYKRILTTESGDTETVKYKAVKKECDGMPYRLEIPLRPFESVVFEFPRVKRNTANASRKKTVKKSTRKEKSTRSKTKK